MASSGNFSVLEPSDCGYANLLEGNLNVTGTSNTAIGSFQSTMGVSSGKWYVEMNFVTKAYSHPSLGINGGTQVNTLDSNQGMLPNLIWYAGNTSNKLNELSMTNDVWGTYSENESSVSGRSNGDVVMIALDVDNKKLWYGANGTWFNSGDPAANDGNWAQSWTSNPNSIHFAFSCYNLAVQVVNFGQDSTFGGRITAGGNADGNGFGDFKYSPPSGFLALCSANLSISDDIDPAQTDDDYPSKQFGVVTYTGNATTGQAITGLGFQPDLVWAKMRSSSQSNFLSDTSRGINKFLLSDNTNAEGTGGGYATVYSSFDSDGFTLGTSGSGPNDSGRTYVAWCWRANGGTTASNTDGSITSTVQANTKAGFSIINFTSPNNTADQTVGHGLSQAPEFIMSKNRDSTFNWDCFHIGLDDTTYGIRLNTDGTPLSGRWGTVNSSTITTKNNYTHSGTDDYVFYAWHSVEGYSKFGSYTGNGNADGPFIYTGFRPRMIFFKWYQTGASAEPWGVFDTARATYNPTSAHSDSQVYWNTTAAASAGSTHSVDFLSNGVKLRGTGGLNNVSGGKYIYGAWGDVPFKYNNTF